MDDHELSNDLMPVTMEQPKGLLYHYTTTEGLLGILQRGCLRATHVRYLNDQSEFEHAYSRKYTDTLIDSLIPGADENLKKNIHERMRLEEEKPDIFLISFTDDESGFPSNSLNAGDRLSQWRSYAGSSFGFSLGFDFFDGSEDGEGQSFVQRIGAGRFFYHCLYSVAEKQAACRLLGEKGLTNFKAMGKDLTSKFVQSNGRQPNDEELSSIKNECDRKRLVKTCVAYSVHATRFKDEAFSEEHEWRIVFYTSRKKILEAQNADTKNPIIQFRSGRFGVTPFIEYPLNFRSENSPLRRIFVGPRSHPDEAVEGVEAVKLLLSANGIQGVEVEKSSIPYRN